MVFAPNHRETPPLSSLKMKQSSPSKTQEKLFRKKSFTNYGKVAAHNTGKSTSLKRKRSTVDSLYDNSKAQTSIMKRAQEVQANLAPEFPSLIKVMLPSHVTGGFWLGLPKQFCSQHLPKHDTIITLEDESGEQFDTKYLVEKVGLSGGWRGFSIAHKLLEGDIAIFRLINPIKFKVYIVRSNGTGESEIDGALGLLILEACTTQVEFDREKKTTITIKQENEEGLVSFLEDKENSQKKSQIIYDSSLMPIMLDHSENDSEDHDGSEVLDGIRLSQHAVEFNKVMSMKNFSIIVNGLIIDSEFSKHLWTKYYELCLSQKSFLHEHLLEGLNCKLASGIISETINIADAIRASKITTSQDYFATWDKTLRAFEVLGMSVSFLRARLDRLVNLATKSKRYRETLVERDGVEEEMRRLEIKLLEVRDRRNRLEDEVDTLEKDGDRLEVIFKEVANAPW